MDGKVLTECGIDYDEGLEKFLQSKDLYDGLLKDFLTDNSFDEAKIAVENKDSEGVIRTIHAMKSVTGTLCMNKLYLKCCDIVDAVRADRFADAEKSFDEAYAMYQKIAEGIRNA